MKAIISFPWGTSASTRTMTLVPAVPSSSPLTMHKGRQEPLGLHLRLHQQPPTLLRFIIDHTRDNIIYVEVKLRHLTIGIKVMALGGASHLDSVDDWATL
jgi:hypothetical protein